MSDADDTSVQVDEYVAAWSASLGQVVSQIAGATVAIEPARELPPDAPAAADSDLYLLIVSAGAVRGEMSLRLPQATALALAQRLLGETPDPAAEFKPDHREAAEELWRQVAGHAATAQASRWGEVQLRVEAASAPSWPPAASGWMDTGAEAGLKLGLQWQLSAAVVASLRPVPPADAAADALPAPSPDEDDKLHLLRDVELDVQLRFGGREMSLREILELSAGSVIELERQVGDPADLLLDNKLIARGELVVVDGNYGLRVTEVIASPN